jgi:hypothetical protein
MTKDRRLLAVKIHLNFTFLFVEFAFWNIFEFEILKNIVSYSSYFDL